MYKGKQCRNCETSLVGPHCHQCGQKHFDEIVSTTAYMHDVAQRVYRFDGLFLRTIYRCLTVPGAVTFDYLHGRRSRVIDPLGYFAACVFVQYVLAWAARKMAQYFDQPYLLNWQEHFSGFVAARFLFIFWFGILWHVMFPVRRRKLSEIFVFATYAFPTVGLLWAVLPFLDLILPINAGVSRGAVIWIKLVVEMAYFIYAVNTFSAHPLWMIGLRCLLVLGTGNAVLLFFMFRD
jgi:hypothetical protein